MQIIKSHQKKSWSFIFTK